MFVAVIGECIMMPDASSHFYFVDEVLGILLQAIDNKMLVKTVFS
ncbi:hypothetical protein [Bartonella sp. CB169]